MPQPDPVRNARRPPRRESLALASLLFASLSSPIAGAQPVHPPIDAGPAPRPGFPQPLPPISLPPPPAPSGRPLTLDETIKAARDWNRDIRAAREHVKQAATDVDRAFASLLPTVALQGKYTFNYPEIKLSLVGQGAVLGGQAQAAAQTAIADNIADLYKATGAAPSASTVSAIQAAQSAQAALATYCQQNPSDFSCASGNTAPITIQPQNQLDASLSVSVPLVVPWAWYGLRAARKALVAQEKNADATEAAVLVQVAAAFFGAAGNDDVVFARYHAIEVADRTVRDAETRFFAGTVNRVEVMRARVSLLEAVQAYREARDAAVASYRALRTLTGIDGDVRADARQTGNESAVPGSKPVDALLSQALSLRPEIAVYERQVDSANANVTSNKLRWLPTLSAFGLGRAFNYGGFANKEYAFAAGLQLDWLLYDAGVRQAGERQAESLAREARLREAGLRDQIEDDVRNLVDQLATRRAALATAEEQVVLARETLDLVRVQREAGTATQLDLLTAQNTLVQTDLNVARARFDLGLTQVQLDRATGAFPGPQ